MSFLSPDGQRPSNSSKNQNQKEDEDLEVDNCNSVLVKIAGLYADQLMSDLVLEVGGVRYPAHRLILCASSEVFQVMLMNREWSEWRETHILLQETPAAAAIFPHFLKYFYTGQIKISYNTVLPILSLADKYNVRDLVSLSLGYMSQHLALAARRGLLVSWMQYTHTTGHTHVAKECESLLKWNVEWAVCAGDLAELELDTLLGLLAQDDLVLHNEMTLYNLVVRWLDRQRESMADRDLGDLQDHWEALVTAVFSHLRFPMMCPRQLAKLLLSPLTQEYKDLFMDRMATAMTYQSGQPVRGVSESLVTPRLYTEDTWGSVLTIDSYWSLPCYHTRTFIFSTRSSLCDTAAQSESMSEWTVDLYPKGVWFQKSLLINWAGTYDVPEVVLRLVRVSVTCHSPPPPQYPDHDPDLRVKIGILVWGVQQGVEHIVHVVQRVHRFSHQHRVVNIDDALDFDELNSPLYSPRDPQQPPHRGDGGAVGARGEGGRGEFARDEHRHLLGPQRDQLKIQVVILPLPGYSHAAADK